MAENDSAASHDIPLGSYELKIGDSFRHSLQEFHTLRFDFKPTSTSDSDAYVAFSGSTDVQVAVSNDGADNLTIYKGSKKPVKGDKECLIVFDRETGQLRLEKLSSNISVKKTRGDSEYEGALKEEIQRLRNQRISVRAPVKQEPLSEAKSSTDDRRSSSEGSSDSSSSDGSGSDSDSDSDNESSAKPSSPPGSPLADRSRKESNKSEESDDLDMQAELEQHLNNGRANDPFMPDDSMPDFGASLINGNGPGSAGSGSTQEQQKMLHDDLQLSESSSSDDDD